MSGAYLDRANPRPLPLRGLIAAGALFAAGALCFLYGLVTNPAAAWRAFHVNHLYFAGIAQGGLLLACILTIVGARWAGPVRRIAESLAAWLPITFLLALVELAGARHIYPWIDEPLPWKIAWLNLPRLALTDLTIFAALALTGFFFLRASLRPALAGAQWPQGGFGERAAGWWLGGFGGSEAERAAALRTTRILAPIICLLFAFGYTLIGFDQVMSLSPTWFSNLFGGFFAWGCFLSSISVTALLSVLHRNSPGLAGQITPARLHDLGKMIFAFSIFWMYLFFSQYLVIWYGNLPEETSFFRDRLGTEFLMSTWYWEGWWSRIMDEPWVKVSLFAWLCVWVIPFWCLLGQRPKRSAAWLASVAAISAFGFWIERNVLVWPSLVPGDTWAFLGVVQVGTALGFLGAFSAVWLLTTRIFPTLAVPQSAE
ncbi:MAG: hypothetical protein OXU65_09300 [Deltaproteobacteria bacterium]|nr:hypothetical protein [Deltaproteobacteria bacterium]